MLKEIFLSFLALVAVYILICVVVAFVKTIHIRIKGENKNKEDLKRNFIEVFIDKLMELLNPLNIIEWLFMQ